jgi:hypothetical protein
LPIGDAGVVRFRIDLPRIPPDAIQVGIVVAGFGLGAATAQANLLASFGVLLGAGFLAGVVRDAHWEAAAAGSVLGSAAVDIAWVVLNERRSEPIGSSILGSIGPALGIGFLLAGAFVLPGYLFGRAYRRSSDTPAWTSGSAEATPPRIDQQPGTGTYVAFGCAILVVVALAIVWIVKGISSMGY